MQVSRWGKRLRHYLGNYDPRRLLSPLTATNAGYLLWGRHTGLLLYMPFAAICTFLFLLQTELDGETVMMSVEQGSFLRFNTTGSRIWAWLAEPISISHLCDRLIEEFEVPKAQREPQVVAFLQNLLERGLIQVIDDESMSRPRHGSAAEWGAAVAPARGRYIARWGPAGGHLDAAEA
jgi:hypothetical protein